MKNRLIQPTPHLRPKEVMRGDLMFKQVAFIYSATITTGSLGGQETTWADKPFAIPTSFQESALEGEIVDVTKPPARYCRIRTRVQGCILWNDKIVVRGIEWRVVKMEEKYGNSGGEFQYLEVRAVYLREAGSINKA